MRLIDADELKDWSEIVPLTGDGGIDINDFDEKLKSMPTVDAVPVRHGKWEMKPDPYGFFDEIPVCTECGCTTKMREKTKYCPHCGARMDEE